VPPAHIRLLPSPKQTMTKTYRVAVALDLAEPYAQHQDVFAGVRRYAHEHLGWQYVIDECPAYDQGRRAELFQHYDGVIARATPRMQQRIRRRGIPLVNTWYQHARRGLPGVYQDPWRMGEIAAEHLIARGFRRISILYGDNRRAAADAAWAAERFCDRAGVGCLLHRTGEARLKTARDWVRIEKSLTAWLDGLVPPVGVCLQEAELARLLINLTEARGWNVPRDMAIVSFNDNRMISELAPQITCIDNCFEMVGYEAAALLDRLMRGEPPSGKPRYIPPKGVISRQSTDYFAVDDEDVAAALRYISVRLHEKLTVERIAQEVAISARSLQMRFSEALGHPISVEIRRLRLTAAQRMLGDPAWQISEIAHQTGFGTYVLMNQVFHRELGMSPSAYRRQVLGERDEG